MSYQVTIRSSDGPRHDYRCAGVCDQAALIYAGKIVEANAALFSSDDAVEVTKDGEKIGPMATVRDMATQAI